MATSFFADQPLGSRITANTQSSIGTIPTAMASYVTQSHKVSGPTVKTTLTLTAVPQTVVNGVEYQGTKLWSFPQGRIVVFDATLSLAQTTTSAIASTLNASSTGAVSVGSATASSTTLNSTMANFLASTAFVSSATINVAGTAVTNELDANNDYSEMFTLDGSSTAIDLYLNSAFATTADVDADATQTWSGTIEIYWMLASYVTGVAA